jgi:hypothetical protein
MSDERQEARSKCFDALQIACELRRAKEWLHIDQYTNVLSREEQKIEHYNKTAAYWDNIIQTEELELYLPPYWAELKALIEKHKAGS